MKKIVIGLLLATGTAIGASSTFAAPVCPAGTKWTCWYIGDIMQGDYSQRCACVGYLTEEKERSLVSKPIVDPNDPNNGLRILDPNDKERIYKK